MRKHLFFIILLLGFFLRFIFLDRFPIGFTPDEASFGYDAFSLLKTGKDQWGESFPLNFRSFGDFKLPLYGYLTVPSVAIFGLNEFSTRLPNVIAGTFAILGTYLLAGVLFKDKRVQLLSALFIAISPWHVSLSRGAFEANLPVFFLSFAVYFALLGLEKKSIGYSLASSVFFGLNLFTYHSARFFTPLLIVMIAIYAREAIFKETFKGFVKRYVLSIVVFLIFLFITFVSLTIGGATRGADVAIFRPTDKWLALSQIQFSAQEGGLPLIVSRVFANKVTYVLDLFVKNYFSYLSPQFLFTKGVQEWTYGMIVDYGVLYFFEIAFLGTLIYFLVLRKINKAVFFLIAWYLLAIIPASLTKGPGLAGNRVAIIMPSLQILSAYGAVLLYELLDRHKLLKNWRLPVFYFLIILCVVKFIVNYFFYLPAQAAEGMLFGRKEIVEQIKTIESNYKEIIISKRLSEPHIYVAFYNVIDPALYQKEAQNWLRYEADGLQFVDQLGEYKLGKFIFKDMYYNLYNKLPDTLLVGKYEEFPQNIEQQTVLNLEYPNYKKGFLIVDPPNQKVPDEI